MRVHEALDAEGVRLWAETALEALGAARAEIDAINVYPVPDGDTGTNLYLTLEAGSAAVAEALDAPRSDDALDRLAAAAEALSRGTLLGARGNSGVILSQYLRGLVDALAEAVNARSVPPGRALATALERGASMAYAAVARPVEGTMLTVGRAAAEAARAQAASDPLGLAAVARTAAEAAATALEHTPEQLAVLDRAGVVDAGGRGMVVLLDALADLLGAPGTRPPRRERRGPTPAPTLAAELAAELAYGGPAFEVMFLLEAEPTMAEALRERLAGMGESVVVVGADRLWNVHVHADDAGAAVEAGVEAGRPFRIRITPLGPIAPQPRREAGRRLVVVTHGPGVATLLDSVGALVVPTEPMTHPASATLLAAVRAADSPEVILLPSDAETRAAADAAALRARDEGVRVAVIPTRSVVQSLAAAAVHDPGAGFDDDVVAMTNAAVSTRYAAVTVAVREVMTSAGLARPGEVMGLVEGDIVEVGASVPDIAVAAIERLLGGPGELVTLVRGCDASDELVRTVAATVRGRHPGVEVVEVDGGQPGWPLIIGVE